jgi:hypothetical protein
VNGGHRSDGRRGDDERGAAPRRRLIRTACCGTVTAAIVAFVALAASAAGESATAQAAGAAAAAPCNYYYEWNGKVRFPLQNDPHATYTFVFPSSDAAKDGVGFLVRGQFVHAAWTSWLTYGQEAQPFSGANFVNNPPANSYSPVRADRGSIDPFSVGEPMQGKPRNFTLLFTPTGYPPSAIASSLDGTRTTGIAPANRKPYPLVKPGKFWVLANRNYQALPGYNPGGTTKQTFPVVTAVDLKTGKAVDCQKYNLVPSGLQRSPTDPPSRLNYGRIPVGIALKNGSHFVFRDGIGGPHGEYAPQNPPGLVQFARAPLGPGADVAQVPPADNCAGYLATRTSTRLVSLVRIPHIANYTNTYGVTPSTTFPNPVSMPWEATYMSFSLYGNSSGFYLPGSPDTMTIADRQFKIDRTGGSTILIWPRNLSKDQQQRVFRYARKEGWVIVRGGTSGRQTSANVLVRIKGAASNYFGSTSKVPCFFDSTENRQKPWSAIPVQGGSKWVATAKNMGAGAPQGVTCSSLSDLQSGRCLQRLKLHIRETGGRYFAR